ncbi:MAG: hypothetical protein CSA18_04055 [Deltaproteobacteria bacterium]|nr:MAG: hypothetical protein CSA18_04055 [Deltaproteobacteria bacterium]
MEDQIVEKLFNFSILREDIIYLVNSVHEDSGLDKEALLYELQILKIISIGLSSNFLLKNKNDREKISEKYWLKILEFSKVLSETSKNFSGVDIDYFDILKKKFDVYLEEINENLDAKEPAAVIGPCFASECGNRYNAFAVLSGAKIFKSCFSGVRKILSQSDYLTY